MDGQAEELQHGQDNYEAILKAQGVSIDIPFAYLHDNQQRREIDVTRDRLTGLSIESDDLRKLIATRLAEALTKDTEWACIYTDADRLKAANTKHGRQFGDMVIRYGAATVLQAVDRVEFNEKAEIFVLRPTHATDETIVWIFDITEKELRKLESEIEAIQPQQIVDPEYEFSITTAILHRTHPGITKSLEQTKQWLEQNKQRIPFNFYQELNDVADAIVQQEKIAKTLLKLQIRELINGRGLNHLIELMIHDFGETRISNAVLEVICKLVSVQTLRALAGFDECREPFGVFLSNLGVSEKQIESTKSPEELLKLFQDLFGSLPEEL